MMGQVQTQSRDLKPLDPVGKGNVKSFLVKAQKMIEATLVRTVQPEILITAVVNSCRKNPKLYECTNQSFLSAVLSCCETGLLPDTEKQEAHLVPYYNGRLKKYEATFISGYRGLIRLAMQRDEIAFVDANVVREGDEFAYQLGTDPFLRHVPSLEPEEGRGLRCYYAIVNYASRDIRPQFEIVSLDYIDRIKDASLAKAKNDYAKAAMPWSKHEIEMGKKTAIRYLIDKRVPKTRELALAVQADLKAEGDEAPIHDLAKEAFAGSEEDPGKSATENLADDIKNRQKSEDPPPAPENTDQITEQRLQEMEGRLGWDNARLVKFREDHLGYIDIDVAFEEEALDELTKYAEALENEVATAK